MSLVVMTASIPPASFEAEVSLALFIPLAGALTVTIATILMIDDGRMSYWPAKAERRDAQTVLSLSGNAGPAWWVRRSSFVEPPIHNPLGKPHDQARPTHYGSRNSQLSCGYYSRVW